MAEAFTLDKTKISGKIGELVTDLIEGLLLLFTGPLKLLEDWGIGGEWIKKARSTADSVSKYLSEGAGSLIGQLVEFFASFFTGSSTPEPKKPTTTPDAKPKDAQTAEEAPEQPSPGPIPGKAQKKEAAKGAGH